MWEIVEPIYQAATILMLVVCVLAMAMTRETLDLLAAAGLVFSFTMMSMWLVDNYPAPWHSAHMVVQDVICAWVSWWASKRSAERWPHWLKIAFTVQCGIHAVYWGGLWASRHFTGGAADAFLTAAYPWPINTLFVIEIAVLFCAGGGHVARNVRDRLRVLHLRAAPFHHGGAA